MSNERLEESLSIDRMSAAEIVRVINGQDRILADAIAAESGRIAQAIDAVADRLGNGGRLFYVGAGTSGRIALLDAAELPPTFGVPADLVQVILAGGEAAIVRAVEGAEDREEDAIAEVDARVRPEDCVAGIAASGTTPFTVAAIRKANMIGALTIGITSTPNSPLAREADIAIVAQTGPEVILGSSRMKSGTAQKMILNTLSTGVMIRLGRVYSNLMVDMPATNAKLQARALQMVELAARSDKAKSRKALEAAGGNVRLAILIAAMNVDPAKARELLDRHDGDLREALRS